MGFFTSTIGLLSLSGTTLVIIIALFIVLAMAFRIVVPTNEVHVIQKRKITEPYGRNKDAGNVYYNWPQWVPRFGITTIILPTSIFDIDLTRYEAYDIGRVPFMVDVKAFFQVEDPETAAQRVRNFKGLNGQLADILRGAVRKILASADIEEIMEGRGTFGDAFTKEVHDQLKAWGVSTVKNIEFMDIKDAPDSKVITNIMAKKKSAIEKESRVVVAGNIQTAQQAEISAQQAVDIKEQEAQQLVGERVAEKEKQIGIAQERANQEIKEQARITAEKDMAVNKVNQEKQAAIDRNVAEIEAEQDKTVKQKAAEADLIEQQNQAEGILITQTKSAEGIKAVGEAEASAKEKMEMASVTPQITLAKEIGENSGYQEYLLGLEGLKVGESIGVAKAEAMGSSEMKIIANAGDIDSGINKLTDLFSSKGGTSVGSMLEALSQTDVGKQLLEKMTGTKNIDIKTEN